MLTPKIAGRFVGIAAATLGLIALNSLLARRAEAAFPPTGEFVRVRGISLHFYRWGAGPAIVLLHGSGSVGSELEHTDMVASLARDHTVIAFDRPGYGFSDKLTPQPSPVEQADLIVEALKKIGIDRAIFVGHSWGTLVALEIGKRAPEAVSGLVLIGGYYRHFGRMDISLAAVFKTPVGKFLAHTVAPLAARILWLLITRRLFAPRKAPESWKAFPASLALRPSQIHTSGQEVAYLTRAQRHIQETPQLPFPVSIIAGTGDRVVEPEQSIFLQRLLPGSELSLAPLQGHMLTHTATQMLLRHIGNMRMNS